MISTAYAQEVTQTVYGTVVDEDTQNPLIGATVIVLNSEPILGASTDVDGRFVIYNVPIGRRDFQFKYLGYETRSVQQIDVGSGKEVVLNIELLESTTNLDEVVVKADKDPASANNEMSVVSTRSFSVEQSDRFAATMNDPGRVALSFAGVNITDDITNEVSIRGNSPKGVLWRLEGIEIPVPNHFNIEGLYAGNVSILSNNILDNSDFSTGAFAAEYGNALSGVFDLRLRTGNDRKHEHTVQVGFLGLEASSEGPFKKGGRSSYLINYRYSTLGLFKAVGANLGGDLFTSFQDLNMKLNFPTKKAGTFSVFFVGGLSNAGYEAETDTTKWDRSGWDQDRVDEDYRNHFLATGVGHKFIINEKNYVHTTLAYTRSGNNLIHSYLTDSLEYLKYWNYQVNNSAIRLATQFNTKFNAKHHLRYGFNYNRLIFKLVDGWPTGWEDEYIADGQGSFYQAYVQHKFRIRNNITLIGGLHTSFFDVNNRYAIEPRLAFDWQVKPRHKLSLGVGMHSRQESLAFYFIKEEGDPGYINRNLDNSKALHVVLGYDFNFFRDFSVMTEVYYQYLYEVPVRSNSSSFSSINNDSGYEKRTLVNEGIGTNYGIELTIEKRFSKNYYFLVTGSFYNSIYQGSDEVWRNTRYNGNYITSVTGGKDFRVGKNGKHLIGANLKFFYAGGRRITPIDLEASREAGEQVRDESRKFEGRVADYYRLDMGVRFKHNLRKVAWEVSLDIQNVTNRLNEINRKYDPKTGGIKKRYQQGMIPVVRFRVEF